MLDCCSQQDRFEDLFRSTHRRAYSLAYNLVGNATDAEDIVQDAYVSAWSHFDSFEPSRSFEAWLYRILINRAIDVRRRRGRIRTVSLDERIQQSEEDRPYERELAAPDSDPARIVTSAVMEERVLRAVVSLPSRYRTPVLLCDVKRLSYQQIADTVHCSIGTVRSRIHRGRHLLRCKLESPEHARSLVPFIS